jgi:protein O-mannosyl-transferase
MKSELPEWFFPGVLAVVVLVLNLNTFRNSLMADDNAFLSGLPKLSQISFSGGGDGHTPLADLSLIANRAISGDEPAGFRAANVIFHGMATLLFFALSTALLKNRNLGFVSALIFVVHPVHVETIQRLQDRGILLAAIALLAALWLGATQPSSKSTAGSICLLYAAALASTPMALVFPVLYAITTGFSRMRAGGRSSGEARQLRHDGGLYGQLFLAGLYLFLLHPPSLPGIASFVENPVAHAPFLSRLLTAVGILGRCLGLLLWPFRLSAEYSYNAVSVISRLQSPQLLEGAAGLVFPAVAAVLVRRGRPVYLFSFLFFLASFLPLSNLFLATRTSFSEGFLYLPSVAICWVLTQFFHDLGWIPEPSRTDNVPFIRKFKAIAVIVVCLLIPWAAKSYIRNEDWKDDRTLWRAAVQTTPQSARARFLLGNSSYSQGDFLGAERQLYQALQIYPDYAEAAIRLAATYEALERYPRAIQMLNDFAGKSGRFEADRLREMGRTFLGMGQYEKAADYYEQALSLQEADPVTHREIGLLYSQFLHDPEKGRSHLDRSRALKEDSKQPRKPKDADKN